MVLRSEGPHGHSQNPPKSLERHTGVTIQGGSLRAWNLEFFQKSIQRREQKLGLRCDAYALGRVPSKVESGPSNVFH